MKIALVTAVTSVLIMTGCKKEASNQPDLPQERKVNSILFTHSDGTTYSMQYDYDNQGLLKEIRYKNVTESFTQTGSTTFQVKRAVNGSPDNYKTDHYTLNSSGAAEKIVSYYPNGNVFSYTNCTYNTGNILETVETTYPSHNEIFRFEYTIENNIPVRKRFFKNGVLDSWEEYSYDYNRSYRGFSPLVQNLYAPGLSGATPRFLLTGISYFDANGNLQGKRTYTAEFDPSGYCIAYTGFNQGDNSLFTYQFNF